MGQYFDAIVKDSEDEFHVYGGSVKDADGNEFHGGYKLTEHSWWLNKFVNGVAKLLLEQPLQIAWIGDYATEYPWYSLAWGKHTMRFAEESIDSSDFVLDGYFLINRTKKEYINCSLYKRLLKEMQESDKENFDDDADEWYIHPLPLLTACGNGRGGGDYPYNGQNVDMVGTWAYNVLDLKKRAPRGYTNITNKALFTLNW